MNSIEALQGQSQPPTGWTPIPPERITEWNDILLETGCSLMQYPYWNEPYRRVGVTPVYLTWAQGGKRAYLCVLSMGPPRLRIGIAFRGPAVLGSDSTLPPESLTDLYRWARSNGYVFIRFTHSDAALLDSFESTCAAHRVDAFPFHRDRSAATHDLVIEQLDDNNAMLASFDREARRKIKRALELEYDLRIGTCSRDVTEVWHLFLKFFARKGIRFHLPLDLFLDAARLAEPHDCLRVYSAWLQEKPVEALLVFRDRQTALCQFAALDVDAIGKHPSPSVLLHWFAMRDMYRMGAVHYNLGPGTGSLLQFKQQFNPRYATYPSPLTVVFNPRLYLLWSKLVLPGVETLKPLAAWLACHLRRDSATEMIPRDSVPTTPADLHLAAGRRS